MDTKVLVTYATKCGSTSEVAQRIAEVLCEGGITADVRPVKDVTSLEGYQAVVIGSAIRMGAWLPEATKFVQTHQTALIHMPTAYFFLGAFIRNRTPETQAQADAYLTPVRAFVEPVRIGQFAGKMDFKKLSWIDRQITKMVKGVEGDFRDWDAITAWAADLRNVGFSSKN